MIQQHRRSYIFAAWSPAVVALAAVLFMPAARAAEPQKPQRVTIRGYHTDAMEPFITKDGRYLLFNNSNDPRVDTNLQFATRIDDLTFEYAGSIRGANSAALDGVPSMDANGQMYFISTRSYAQNLATIYHGQFDQGALAGLEVTSGLAPNKKGNLNFDAEISADGNVLFAVDGKFSGDPVPDSADIFVAVRDGNSFRRLPESAAILKTINTSALEYAPAISTDLRELYFTRAPRRGHKPPVILHASRTRTDEPFGTPRPVPLITGFVEAPSLSQDGCWLYFHKNDGGRFAIYRVDSGANCPPNETAAVRLGNDQKRKSGS